MYNKFKKNFFSELMIKLIKIYRYWISPFIPNSCRFYPSCSAYSLKAYQNLGFWQGTWLSLKRIIKCNPFNSGGIDLLPKGTEIKCKDYNQ